jgi:hypothetical protein
MKQAESRFRLDGVGELNYLSWAGTRRTARARRPPAGKWSTACWACACYKDNMSLALAVKKPLWTDLNEEHDQQGAEGKENYRFIANFSVHSDS